MWFKRQFTLVAVLSFINTAGCGTIIYLPAMPDRPTSDYHLSQESSGLSVAVDPLLDSERVKNFFGLDLLSEGLLPVLVVVENHHEQDVFVAKRALVLLTLKGGDAWNAGPVLAKGNTQLAGATGALASLVLTPPIIGLPAAIGLSYFAESEVAKARLIKSNLERKEFLDRTVYPGEAHRGFVYFKLGNRDMVSDLVAVKVEVEKLRRWEKVSFVFYLDGEEAKRP